MARARANGSTTNDLFDRLEVGSSDTRNLPSVFRKVYFHLYSNSNASRPDAIVEDLSMLLLTQLAAEQNGQVKSVVSFNSGGKSANDALIPLLRKYYPTIHQDQRFSLEDKYLRTALRELDSAGISHAPAHALGEAFQALIGPRLRGERGQFFTPKSLVKAMVQIVDPKPGESVADPACGTGGFLAEAHIHQSRLAKSRRPTGALVGVDKDGGLARLATALVTLIAGKRAEIHDFNSLDTDEWQSTIFAKKRKKPGFDVILTNPPFGARIGITDPDILGSFAFGHLWTRGKGREGWTQTRAIAASQDPQILFIEQCVNLLRPNGRLGIVLPEGVFGNKNIGYVWDWLEENGEVYALLDCPRTTFQPGTDTKTNVLFFRKNGSGATAKKQSRSSAKIAVALNCGHDRRGRNILPDGTPYADDFPILGEQFSKRNSAGWQSAAVRGKRYLVPRYFAHSDAQNKDDASLIADAKSVTLRSLVQRKVIKIRKGHEVGSEAYGTGEIPFVRTSDLANYEISSDPTKSVSQAVYDEYAPQQNLKEGDILLVVDGRYRIGTSAIIGAHDRKCVVQSHLKIISILKPEVLDPFELLFALNLPSVRLRMRSLVFIQSTLGTIGDRLMELRVPMLHGDGPWSSSVRRFRKILQERGDLLAKLRTMSAKEYDL